MVVGSPDLSSGAEASQVSVSLLTNYKKEKK